MLDIYGIKNCDTVRKALKWATDSGLQYAFRDIRKDPVSRKRIAIWVDKLGVEAVLNTRGTTWRNLDDADRELAEVDEGAIDLMHDNPTLIKRPVIEGDGHLSVGFTPDIQNTLKARHGH